MKATSIMIVETNPDLRNTLRHAFEDHGYLTWTCPGTEMAVSIFTAVHPSIVLLDLDFEGPSPLRLIYEWKAQSPTTRVIVESTTADAVRMREAMDHGAHAYLVKPYTLAPLFDLIEKNIPPGPPSGEAFRKAALRHSRKQKAKNILVPLVVAGERWRFVAIGSFPHGIADGCAIQKRDFSPSPLPKQDLRRAGVPVMHLMMIDIKRIDQLSRYVAHLHADAIDRLYPRARQTSFEMVFEPFGKTCRRDHGHLWQITPRRDTDL